MGLTSWLQVSSAPTAAARLDNDDLRPVPRERRTWGLSMYTLYWFVAVGNVTNFSGGGSWLAEGYSFWEGIGCSTAGYFLISWVMTVNGRPGSKWHLVSHDDLCYAWSYRSDARWFGCRATRSRAGRALACTARGGRL